MNSSLLNLSVPHNFQKWVYHDALTVPCPLCGQCVGDPCVPSSLDRPHEPRIALAGIEDE